jgi:DNA-binding PadR family transcriptional regulator
MSLMASPMRPAARWVESLPVRPDAVRGHLDGLILSVLEEGPRHGYAIIEALLARSGGSLDLPTGTVYPALRRLERAGKLSGSWSTVGGRERRTYTLTRSGRHALAAQRTDWSEFSSVVEAVLRPGPAAEST